MASVGVRCRPKHCLLLSATWPMHAEEHVRGSYSSVCQWNGHVSQQVFDLNVLQRELMGTSFPWICPRESLTKATGQHELVVVRADLTFTQPGADHTLAIGVGAPL